MALPLGFFFFKLNRTGAAKSDGWAGFALV